MKKLLIFSLCLFLCGCSPKAPKAPAHLQTIPYAGEEEVTSVQNVTVYLYNEQTHRLESKIVPITIYPDQSRAEAALIYLLSTPAFEFSLNSYGVPDYTLTISGGIAGVHITNPYSNEDEETSLALHFSIVNTLTAIEGVNFASVYAAGSELCHGAYIGPSRFLDKSVMEHAMEVFAPGKAEISQNPMLLYFADKGHAYAVPEHHSIYSNIKNPKHTMDAVLSQMARQPVNSTDLTSPISSTSHVLSANVKDNIMTVDFDAIPWDTKMDNNALSAACLYYTITGIYPNIDTVNFTVKGKATEAYPTIDKNTFTESIGSAITLYMTSGDMDSLYPVNRYISASTSKRSAQIIEALIEGPLDGDRISPIFGGLTDANLISAKVVNDLALINFDTAFYDAVRSLSPIQESIMIYAMVNSLTEQEQINRVQFLINGQAFETINGNINYLNPLISNPGLVLK